jgi:hypothetical protein
MAITSSPPSVTNARESGCDRKFAAIVAQSTLTQHDTGFMLLSASIPDCPISVAEFFESGIAPAE